MPGNRIGGLKASATNKARYGNDWYAKIGRKGGQNGHTGGFAANPELAKEAGRKGGTISRRGPAKYPHLSKTSASVRDTAERRRLKAEIRALEAEEEW
jgi:general stress protein YciG